MGLVNYNGDHVGSGGGGGGDGEGGCIGYGRGVIFAAGRAAV